MKMVLTLAPNGILDLNIDNGLPYTLALGMLRDATIRVEADFKDAITAGKIAAMKTAEEQAKNASQAASQVVAEIPA